MNIRSVFNQASPLSPLIALIAGAINVLAFAPFGLWPVQILTLALVFALVKRAPPRRSALIGWAYSFGWLLAGVHWLYISMHRYGGLPSWMAAAAVVLLAAVLAVFAALAFGGSAWLRQRWPLRMAPAMLLLFPAMWTLAEWLRGWVFTGFPWVSSGYAHTLGPLAGFAPLVGVYGLGFIAALIAACLALLPSRKLPLVLTAALLAAGFALTPVEWTTPHGLPISVRLLQGNVPQEMKFAPERIESTLALYHDMIVDKPANLIVTPETAIPMLSSQLPPDYLERLSGFARASNSHVVLGIPVNGSPRHYANSAIGLAPTDVRLYRYDKHHLVPFGEFIPLGARWFVEMMRIPLGDFSRGELLQAPFAVGDQSVLPNICYEDLFGEEIAAQLAASRTGRVPEATILLNLSNIAWFGDSIALPQHLQISQMRAMETGRPMLRATNTGATAVVSPKGAIITQLPPFQRDVLSASVQGYKGLTPYTLYGNALVVGVAFILLFAAWLTARIRHNNPHKPLKTR